MSSTTYFTQSTVLRIGLVVSLSFLAACTDRGQNPPSVRDGVSVGAPEPTTPTKPGRPRDPLPDDIEPPKSPLGEHGYSVLVNTFDNRLDADHLSFQLRMQRINNMVYLYGDEWRVCVGVYATRGRARRTLKQVYEKGFTTARVIGPGDDGVPPPPKE